MSETYLISSDEGHSLLVHRLTALEGDEGMISINSNDRTLCFSPSMAKQLSKALLAIESGLFTRAVTETYLRLETDRANRGSHASATTPTTPLSTPTLESL